MSLSSLSPAFALALVVLFGASIPSSARAQASNWEQGLQMLRKKHAAELLAFDQRMLEELDAQIKKSTQRGDIPQANSLNERRAEIVAGMEELKRVGKSAPTGSDDAQGRKITKAVEGTFWTLENTTNVKAVVFDDGRVRSASPNGKASGGAVADAQMFPGLFFGKRSDGSSSSAYVLSPDLKRMHSFIFTSVNKGTLNKN